MTNDFAPEIPDIYPRPQLFRPDYRLLDGEWSLNGRPIRVPFPPEAPMSGFGGKAGEVLHYEKDFMVPSEWKGKRILLHFGAVDQIAKVTLNDVFLGRHTGGYLGFTFDITDHVRFAEDKSSAGRAAGIGANGTADAVSGKSAFAGGLTNSGAKDGGNAKLAENVNSRVASKNATYENVKRISGQSPAVQPGLNNLVVTAIDRNDPTIPYGKQSKDPQGMWYTGVSGIWKSVWLEAVPETYIEKIKLVPDTEGVNIRLYLNRSSAKKNIDAVFPEDADANAAFSAKAADANTTHAEFSVKATDSDANAAFSAKEEGTNAQGENISHRGQTQGFRAVIVGEGVYPSGFGEQLGSGETFHFSGDRGRLEPMDPVLWSPDNPHLYRLRIDCGEDTVYTYFGLRAICLKQFGERKRPTLNGKAVFLNGVLDQGYFPEGIFVPGTMTAYDRDILAMKELGFNMLRKHIKVEPDYYYAACDRHGMLVMQDMVQSGHYSFIWDTFLPYFQGDLRPDENVLGPGQDRKTEKTRRKIFVEHTKQTVVELYNHPSIIAWTIFNEGWGQFESAKMYHMVKRIDPNRLIDSASGWMDRKVSDFDSRHQYFRNRLLKPKDDRPLFISECGGFGYDLSPEDREKEARKQRLINIEVNHGHPWKAGFSRTTGSSGRKSVNIAVPEKLQPLQEKIVEGEDRFDEKMAELGSRYDAAVDRRELRDHRGIDAAEAIDLIRKQYSEKSGKEFQYGGGCKDSAELTQKIIQMYKEMIFTATHAGLCGLVYTQLSDVENEVNGLYTYDRTVCKVEKAKLAALGKMLSTWYETDAEE